MSVSSVGSTVSVGFHGREAGIDEALDHTVRALQAHMNRVQLTLQHIAVVAEQDEDYETELRLSWDLDEDLLNMSFLFDDLRGYSLDMITVPGTKEEKAMAKKFKADRKEHEKKAIADHKARLAEERAAYKLSRKMALANIDEQDEEMKRD